MEKIRLVSLVTIIIAILVSGLVSGIPSETSIMSNILKTTQKDSVYKREYRKATISEATNEFGFDMDESECLYIHNDDYTDFYIQKC